MPRATADITTTKRFDLKSLEEAFVTLKRLTYGQILERQSMITMNFVQESERGSKDKKTKSEMSMANVAVTLFEFSHSIVDHNLEDETGRILNFALQQDILRLDPRVGQEIDQLISQYNKLDAEYKADDEEGTPGN